MEHFLNTFSKIFGLISASISGLFFTDPILQFLPSGFINETFGLISTSISGLCFLLSGFINETFGLISSPISDLFFSDPILQFLLSGLQEPKLASAAANSVQCISTSCKGKMRDHFQGLINIAQAIDTLHLSNEAVIGFLKGQYH
jgi:hypothetical protein